MKSWQASFRKIPALTVLSGALTTFSGCSTTDQIGKLEKVAKVQGEARAQTTVPGLPPECREHMERVVPKLGEKVRWTHKRWEYSADQADAQIDRCAQFHDDWAGKAQK
jgi:crotonobetainyl-CoA:carnitine CoA-transferase CaiB-like acyl-CoA transferase